MSASSSINPLKYTDKRGGEYDIDSHYQAGNIVLLADSPPIGFRFDRSALAAVSPVFQDMFTMHNVEGNVTEEVHFNADAHTQGDFLSSIRYPKQPLQWPNAIDVINFARTYDCDAYIREVLYAASLNDPGDLRLDAFALTCSLNHLPAACRLLRRAGTGESGRAEGKSLRPNAKEWTPEDSEKLSPKWLWALTCGVMWADGVLAKPDHGWVDRTRDDYWIAVVGEFMSRITMSAESRRATWPLHIPFKVHGYSALEKLVSPFHIPHISVQHHFAGDTMSSSSSSESDSDSSDSSSATRADVQLYTDSKGKVYKLSRTFRDGDITLIGSGTAYKFTRSKLEAVSPVFRDIFANGNLGGSEIHTASLDSTLSFFLAFLTTPSRNLRHRLGWSWTSVLPVIDFARKFECDGYIRDLLDAASHTDPCSLRIRAFTLASEYNHLSAACRLLRHAGSGEAKRSYDTVTESLRPNAPSWTSANARALPHQWLWALTCAVQWADAIEVDGKKLAKTGEDYWTAVMGAFMLRMTMWDILLLTDPEEHATAYRIHKSSLAKASPVFRDMFSGPFDGAHIHLDAPPNVLKPFLQFLTGPHILWSYSWPTSILVLDLAQRYQCDSYIRDLTYIAAVKDPGEDRFEAFVWAARYDHLTAACRLLRWGGSGELPARRGKSLRPNTEGWTPQDVAKLPNQWLWALTCAIQWADEVLMVTSRGETQRTKEAYWKAVVGEFMIRMTM